MMLGGNPWEIRRAFAVAGLRMLAGFVLAAAIVWGTCSLG